MLTQIVIWGWLAFIIFLFSCSYSLFKRNILPHFNKKMNLSKLLNWHCYLGILSTMIAFIHVGKNFYNIKFSVSFICLYSLILLCISGIIMKYFKNAYLRHRSLWRNMHVLFTVIFIITFLWHMLLYHFLY